MSQYIQYGCGLCAPPRWRNFDVSPTLRLQKIPLLGSLVKQSDRFPTFPANAEYGDVVKGLPVANSSCRAIYCSHVLEHLALSDLRVALSNTYAYLSPGGYFRLVLPDLKQLAKDYLASQEPEAARRFMERSCLGVERRPRGPEGLARALFGNSKHLWMWDEPSLRTELREAGFQQIRRAEFGDSEEPAFSAVEERGRWKNCLGIECRK